MRAVAQNHLLLVRDVRAWSASIALIAAMASVSSVAYAQNAAATAQAAPPAPAAAPDAAEATGPLQEIVVTATRHEESLSKVPISVTALTQDAMDVRGIKDILDVARFTPGINIDNSGTNNIAIRGIASTGGAGTTGIYLDDTPIQMRALAFNPDDALPQSFDLDRVEVLRGPQGTLFGAGSEGGTVRYITTQPSLTQTSIYSRNEISTTQGGVPNYEVGVAAGTPVIDGKLGVRVSAWYRYDGGYINLIDPVSLNNIRNNANYIQTKLFRVAARVGGPDNWKVDAELLLPESVRERPAELLAAVLEPKQQSVREREPDSAPGPDTFYIPALKIEGDLGKVNLISNTSYYHRQETTGYDGTLYNLGFYQANAVPPAYPVFGLTSFLPGVFPMLDGNGLHLPAGATDYRSPASVANGQQDITQEVRLQSADSNAPLIWTTGLFFSYMRQSYLEQIHDPMLNELSLAATGLPYTDFFYYTDANGNNVPVTYDPRFPNDSYFLQTHAQDKQIAMFGEGTYSFTDQWKTTVGARYSRTKFSFNTLTGGPQLFLPPQSNSGDKKENSFTPKVSLQYQYDPRNLYYVHLRQGLSPGRRQQSGAAGGLRHGLPNFGISQAPPTFNSDTVDSFEIGAKNNFNNRVKIASSVYYIRWNNIQQTVVPPDLPDLVHHQPGAGGGQGRGHPGRNRRDRQLHGRAFGRLHRCALHRGLEALARRDHADRRERRCHRRPERPAGTAGHRLDRTPNTDSACSSTTASSASTTSTRAGPSGPAPARIPARCSTIRPITPCRRPISHRRAAA